MSMHTKFILVFLLVLSVCAGLGYVGFSNLRYQKAYELADAQLQRANRALSNGGIVHGVFRSFEESSGMLEIEAPNLYESKGSSITYRFPLLPSAFIGRQELSNDPTGTLLPPATPATLKDLASLAPGTRMKFLLLIRNGTASISYLVFGNPL